MKKALALLALWSLGFCLIVRYLVSLLVEAGSCYIKDGAVTCHEPAVGMFWIVVGLGLVLLWTVILYLVFGNRKY